MDFDFLELIVMPPASHRWALAFSDWLSFDCSWNSWKRYELNHLGDGLEALWGQVTFNSW